MLVLGHRGAPEDRPENTLESFSEALRQGADGVELDARLGAGGELVVWHDPSVRVAAGSEIAVHETPVDDLMEIDITAATAHQRWSEPTRVCTLEQALTIAGEAIVDIELKNLPGEPLVDSDHRLPRLVVELAEQMGVKGNVVITSFWSDALDVVVEMSPDIEVGWLLIPGVSPTRVIDDAVSRGYSLVLPFDTSLDLEAEPDVFSQVRDAGLRTWTWTVNDLGRMEALAEAGIDGIITDFPGRCAEIARRR